MYSTVSGARELIPFVTSGVMTEATLSGHILRGDGDIDAWLRPVFQTPFTGSVDKILQGVSEAFGAAYALDAYTGTHLSNKMEKVDELRGWAAKRLNMCLERPLMLTNANHPMQDPWGSQYDNSIMYAIPTNRSAIDITKPETEWRFGSKLGQQV